MIKNPLGGTGGNRRQRASGRYIRTRSGKTLKVHQNLGQKLVAMKEAKALRRVNRLRGLPKSRLKRLLWRLQPKRLAAFWLSRDGGILALKIVGITILVIFVLTLAVFAYFRKDLPDISVSGANLGGSVSYYDRTGQTLLWQDYNTVKRVPVQSKDISPYLKDATVAVEDRDFYNHKGFDVKGIGRAAYNDIFRHGSTQGGSTITQQLVKITADWTQQRTFSRKVKEIILAVELERSYTKDEILTGYLNAAPYGGLDYGAQAATSDYFHKNAKDLTLAEAAMLAAIPKSPAYYSPYDKQFFDRTAFIDRYNYVLDSMVQTGKIQKKDAEAAKKVDVLAEVQPQQTKYAGIRAPYFVLAARDQVLKFCSGTNGSCAAKVGGWKVITTVDMTLQNKAEQLVQSNLANVSRYQADEEALVLEDTKTGQMLALVGGTDFDNPEHGQLNYAHSVYISPGSSFKPYDYSTLIENHSDAGAGSVLYDSQGPLPGYPCTDKSSPPPRGHGNCLMDYDFRFPGPETLRYALGGSRNIPAVKAMLEAVPNDTSPNRTTSINKVINTANDMMSAPGAYGCFADDKLTIKTQCYGASAIGDGAYLHLDQHVNGVATLGRLGQAIPTSYILKIIKADGKPAYTWQQPKSTQVIRAETAYVVDNMVSDPNASYLAGSMKWHRYKGWTNAIKTGTTNNSFDGLMMSWNTQFAVGSWVGYHTRNVALTTFMENLTTPLTRGMMTYALDSLHGPPVNWTEPGGIKHLPAYVVQTHIGVGSVEPSPGSDIYPSWYQPKSTSNAAPQTIDKVSGKIATDCTPALAKQNLSGSAAPNSFSIDVFYGTTGSQSNQPSSGANGSDDVHSCSDTRPTITLTAPESCSSSCTFTATASQGSHPLNDPQYAQFPGTINFMVNGQVVKTVTFSDPSVTTQSIDYTPSASGQATVTAQVIDSVLYDSTSEPSTVNFTQPGNPPATTGPTNLTAATTGTGISKKTNFSWSGGSGIVGVYNKNSSSLLCSSANGSCSTFYGLAPSGTVVYAQDSQGQKSNETTVP